MSRLAHLESQFAKLIQDGEAIKSTAKTSGGSSGRVISIPMTYVDDEKSRVWSMNLLTLVRSTFGTEHHYFLEIQNNLSGCCIYDHFIGILSCARSAMDSLRNGFLFETKTLVEADVASDYLEQATLLMDAGYKDAAAVIGGSVLERHLRQMCDTRNISIKKPNGKPMSINDLNEELAKANAFNLLKKKQITSWADVRNNAAHGDYGKYTSQDVITTLRDIATFCADHN